MKKEKVSRMPFCYVGGLPGREGKMWGAFTFEENGIYFIPTRADRGDALFVPYESIIQVISRGRNMPNVTRIVWGVGGSALVGVNELAIVFLDNESKICAVRFREKMSELTNQIAKVIRVIDEERGRFLAQSGTEPPTATEEEIVKLFVQETKYKPCPKCGCKVFSKAIKCRHCGSDLTQAPSS